MEKLIDGETKNPWPQIFMFLHMGGEWDYQYENEQECGKKYDKLLTKWRTILFAMYCTTHRVLVLVHR